MARREMDEETIRSALSALSDELGRQDVQGELCLLGGTTMVLAFHARQSTKDVDAIFHPAAVLREAAEAVRLLLDLPDHWLNDAAKGFVSHRHEVATYDLPQFPHLRIVAPVPEYLLAMKCMASRIGSAGDADDKADIRFLLDHLNVRSSTAALEIATKYYPPERVPIRAKYLIEEILAEIQ